jgi:hypothetical protein
VDIKVELMALSRLEFKQHWDKVLLGMADDDSPLWTIESFENYRPSRWFVCIKPIATTAGSDQEFWKWYHVSCRGQILCYSSSDAAQEEWWGFTHRADIMMFLLKWST